MLIDSVLWLLYRGDAGHSESGEDSTDLASVGKNAHPSLLSKTLDSNALRWF